MRGPRPALASRTGALSCYRARRMTLPKANRTPPHKINRGQTPLSAESGVCPRFSAALDRDARRRHTGRWTVPHGPALHDGVLAAETFDHCALIGARHAL